MGIRVFKFIGTHWGKRKFIEDARWYPSGQSLCLRNIYKLGEEADRRTKIKLVINLKHSNNIKITRVKY